MSAKGAKQEKQHSNRPVETAEEREKKKLQKRQNIEQKLREASAVAQGSSFLDAILSEKKAKEALKKRPPKHAKKIPKPSPTNVSKRADNSQVRTPLEEIIKSIVPQDPKLVFVPPNPTSEATKEPDEKPFEHRGGDFGAAFLQKLSTEKTKTANLAVSDASNFAASEAPKTIPDTPKVPPVVPPPPIRKKYVSRWDTPKAPVIGPRTPPSNSPLGKSLSENVASEASLNWMSDKAAGKERPSFRGAGSPHASAQAASAGPNVPSPADTQTRIPGVTSPDISTVGGDLGSPMGRNSPDSCPPPTPPADSPGVNLSPQDGQISGPGSGGRVGLGRGSPVGPKTPPGEPDVGEEDSDSEDAPYSPSNSPLMFGDLQGIKPPKRSRKDEGISKSKEAERNTPAQSSRKSLGLLRSLKEKAKLLSKGSAEDMSRASDPTATLTPGGTSLARALRSNSGQSLSEALQKETAEMSKPSSCHSPILDWGSPRSSSLLPTPKAGLLSTPDALPDLRLQMPSSPSTQVECTTPSPKPDSVSTPKPGVLSTRSDPPGHSDCDLPDPYLYSRSVSFTLADYLSGAVQEAHKYLGVHGVRDHPEISPKGESKPGVPKPPLGLLTSLKGKAKSLLRPSGASASVASAQSTDHRQPPPISAVAGSDDDDAVESAFESDAGVSLVRL